MVQALSRLLGTGSNEDRNALARRTPSQVGSMNRDGRARTFKQLSIVSYVATVSCSGWITAGLCVTVSIPKKLAAASFSGGQET